MKGVRNMFIVVFMKEDGRIKAEHIEAANAQAAADAIREKYIGAIIREISKVDDAWT